MTDFKLVTIVGWFRLPKFILVILVLLSSLVAWMLAHSSSVEAGDPCFSPAGTLPWPVPTSAGIAEGYLQVQVNSGSDLMYPHVGVDVLAEPGTEVESSEDGVFALEGGTDPNYWMIVESASAPGTGIRYMHVDSASVTVDLYDSVTAGKVLAKVAEYTSDTDYDHLHLEAVQGYLKPDGTWYEFESIENPLKQLAAPEDELAPAFIVPDSTSYLPEGLSCGSKVPAGLYWPFWIRKSGDTDSLTDYYCPDDLPNCVELDIVCQVADWTKAEDGLAASPCCARVQIVHKPSGSYPPVEIDPIEMIFDGISPGSGAGDYLAFVRDGVLDSDGVWSGERTLYLVPTNQPGTDGFWKPCTAGNYTITIELRDAAGNSVEDSMDVTVN